MTAFLIFVITLYCVYYLFVSIPSWGELRILGVSMTMFKLVVGSFYLAIMFNGPVAWIALWQDWSLWVDLLLLFISLICVSVIYMVGLGREKFNSGAFIAAMAPIIPIFGVTSFKMLSKLFS